MKTRTWFNRKAPGHAQGLEILSIGRWEYHVSTREVRCSPEVYQIFGLTSNTESLRPNMLVERIHPADREIIRAYWRQVFQDKLQSRSFTYRIRGPQNQSRYVQGTAECVYDENGTLTHVEGTLRDVTRMVMQHNLFVLKNQLHVLENYETDPLVILDKHLNVAKWNQASQALFGWSEKELLLHQPVHLRMENKEAMYNLYQTALQHGGTICFDNDYIRRDGTTFTATVCLFSLHNELGEIIGVAEHYQPLIHSNMTEQASVQSEPHLHALTRHSSDVFLTLTRDMRISYVSNAIENVLGHRAIDVAQTDFLALVHPNDRQLCEEAIQNLSNGKQNKIKIELQIQNKDGIWRICDATFHNLHKGKRTDGYIVNFHDITENKQTQELMNYIADHDWLTDLPNRRAFEEQLSAMIGLAAKRNHPFAVLTMNLNKFKYINDTLGHSIGDKLIQTISQDIRTRIPSECIVARIGADEFAILVPGAENQEHVYHLADQLLHLFEREIRIDQYAVYVSAGIGISFYPIDGTDTETLMKHADIALHHAKDVGHSAMQVYSTNLTAGAYKQFSLANDFRTALRNNDFVLHYQPRIDAVTGRIVAAEALIRWDHEDWGLVSPGEFIQIAEDNGLIVPLGDWVIETVCQQLQTWSNSIAKGIKVSVNVSAKQFLVANFVDSVRNALKKYNVPPQQLEFEITETTIMPNEPSVVKAIEQLRTMGIAIFFDDFGTGYSSLSWLHRYELDGIKLDRSFVSHVPDHWAPTQIVSSVIQLAHSLGLTVVAEGVETIQQLDFLKQAKCEQIQGFLFSKPVPAQQFEELLRTGVLTPNPVHQTSPAPIENRRKHFRVTPPHPMVAMVTIAAVNSRRLSLGYTDILLMDIGPGGLRFVSNLRFPANHGVVLHFKLTLFKRIIELEGSIVWSEEVADNLLQYGVEFSLDEAERKKLFPLFNDFAIQVQAGKFDGEWFTGPLDSFFQS
ncbi:EAL domain-containing protein [Alicyclobacillus acidoterrestris]|uniref:EAL domain-containing protein n=1 Tax=Alicyclobacillus acidoterrestris (strain ATCC 49025 / DSM 3922 / CIP 106132 / NCIMB 13137 / GD3B) TaxID=1356854 RepID=T0BEZ8_ALIAG|nr:EAL domain-containing protein [Alicyclobacillus acidoterrestris]EPZ42538.1 hypothetical protein N007_01790 [Alicyclobacillus acidoterrestris ATCC 49025]UNO49451.1 EAL domain-containing protein [Alicyclobacillus acidoterrestris]